MHGTAEQTAHIEKVLGSISLPPCPSILLDIQAEMRKEEPDFARMAGLIGNDAGLSASVLKLVNSPAFRRGSNIGSIRQAVSVLGLKKIVLAVNTLALRNSVAAVHPTTKVFLEKFWDKSACTAEASMMLAGKLPGIHAEDAYTIGLFHDSGIPVLMQRFPEHPFDAAQQGNDWDSIHLKEEAALGTNHAIVGNLLARNWGLPAHICQTILHHHDATIFADHLHQVAPEVRNFSAVLILANHLVGIFMDLEDESAMGRLPFQTRALRYLGLELEEFCDIAADVLGELRHARA